MSGGNWEYVMGNLNNKIQNSGFVSLPDSKYYDNYTSTNKNNACNNKVCYGHALSETPGWYDDQNLFLTETGNWLVRGGGFPNKQLAGLFSTYGDEGIEYTTSTSRVSIVPGA